MPNQTVKLTRMSPYFPVANVEQTVEFYNQKLGFQTEYKAGSPLQFAILSRDGLGIMVRLVSDPELITPCDKQGGTWDAFFWVDDVDGLHRELTEKGASIVYGPLIQESYQMKEFAVRDGDGHVLGFGQKWTTENGPK